MSVRRLFLGFACVSVALGAAPDGAAVYKTSCAVCHDHPQDRVPAKEALASRSADDVLQVLTTGAMREQAKTLSDGERRAVAAFLTGKELSAAAAVASAPETNRCTDGPSPIKPSAGDWNGWGYDPGNSRYQPSAGLKAEDVPKLKVKWAFGYPGNFTYGQPTVIGDRLYVTSGTGKVYALNAKTGCTYWSSEGGTSARTAISVGKLAGGGSKYAVYFGDDKAIVHALDADTGQPLWQTKVDDHPVARVTGSPILYQDKLYVPVSSIEEVSGRNPKYECCKFRGSVVALNASTGKQVWKTHTISDPPTATKKNSVGTQMYGPAGAAVWSAPTLDLKRKVVYVGTGNSYTDTEQRTANSILAIDMETGSLKWSMQATSKDNYLVGCPKPGVGNCPEEAGPDVDFGSSPVLRTLANGKQVLLAGQKSGAVYGLDPDQRGKILWRQKPGEGSPLGGVEWGFAADNENAYIAISDVATNPDKARPSLTAFKIGSGDQAWQTPAPRIECSFGKSGCMPAQSQAVTAIPGAVFSGSMDGHLRAYLTRDGSIVWDFDTGVPFEAVNGVPAKGGSLDEGGPTVAHGMVFVNSGYGRIMGRAGNVLLAFSVDGK